MKRKLYNFNRRILSFLYPNRCGFCGKLIHHNQYSCDDCLNNLPYCDDNNAGLCNVEKLNSIDHILGICYYKDNVKSVVIELKDKNNGYAIASSAKLMADKILREGITADFIIPVPASKEVRIARGYNQAELLSKEIAVLTNIPINSRILFSKAHLSQKTLSTQQRKENSRKSFTIRNSLHIKGKTIILVDDVATTGSTLDSLAFLLKKGGASRVLGLVFSRTLIENSYN